MLKAILLDVDNTLLSFDEYVKQAMRDGFRKFGIGRYEDGMFDTFTRINSGLWQALERGELSFAALLENRWNRVFEALGFTADGAAFEKYFGECLNESAIPEEGAMELLEYLHGKYILCVASNGPYQQQLNRLRLGGMLPCFSHLFISGEIGSSKPSEAFFSACLHRLNLNAKQRILPCELMIIGDSISSDIAGGMQFGMQTCLYNPGKRPIPGDLRPDYQVASLREIKKIL